MEVIVNKKALIEAIVETLSTEEEEPEFARISIDGENEPIKPIEMMSTQLVEELPPVEDPEFIPVSLEELGRSAYVIAQEVPVHQIEFVYRHLHKLLDKALDRQTEMELSVESIRRSVRLIMEDDEPNDGEEEGEPSSIPWRGRAPRYEYSISVDDAHDKIMNYIYYTEKGKSFTRETYDMNIQTPDGVYSSTYGETRNVDEIAEIMDEIMSDVAITSILQDVVDEDLEELKTLVSNDVKSLLKDPMSSSNLGAYVQSAANKVVEMILKGMKKEMKDAGDEDASVDVDEFISRVRAAVKKEKDHEKALNILVIGNSVAEDLRVGTDHLSMEQELEAMAAEEFEDEVEEVDEEELRQIRAAVRSQMREDALASEFEPGTLQLSPDALRALMEKIADQIGTKIGNVRNIIYDDLKVFGLPTDVLKRIFGVRRMPGGRDKIPLMYDMLRLRAADEYTEKLYELLRSSLKKYIEGQEEDPASPGKKLAISHEDELNMLDKFLGPNGWFQPGLEGYQRLQAAVGGPGVDEDIAQVESSKFLDTRVAYELVQVFIDQIAQGMVAEDVYSAAKEGGMRALLADLESTGVFDSIDEREEFDNVLAGKLKMMDRFDPEKLLRRQGMTDEKYEKLKRRRLDGLMDMVDEALRLAPKRRDKYVKRVRSELEGQ